jgi:hypothetical protein
VTSDDEVVVAGAGERVNRRLGFDDNLINYETGEPRLPPQGTEQLDGTGPHTRERRSAGALSPVLGVKSHRHSA